MPAANWRRPVRGQHRSSRQPLEPCGEEWKWQEAQLLQGGPDGTNRHIFLLCSQGAPLCKTC